MNTTIILKNAIAFATLRHKGQKRKSGEPFITHPLAVASAFPDDEERQIVAVLHDVLEDTNTSASELLDIGIPYDLVQHVLHLTRMVGENYHFYISRVAMCSFCRPIKVVDMRHNLSTITEEMMIEKPDLKEKYKKYMKIILSTYFQK